MQSENHINMNVVAQSAIALSMAIIFTDAVRECLLAVRPQSAIGFAILRLIVAIILIMLIIYIIEQQKVAKAHIYIDSKPTYS